MINIKKTINRSKIVLVSAFSLLFVFSATSSFAALTFTTNQGSSDGALTLTSTGTGSNVSLTSAAGSTTTAPGAAALTAGPAGTDAIGGAINITAGAGGPPANASRGGRTITIATRGGEAAARLATCGEPGTV